MTKEYFLENYDTKLGETKRNGNHYTVLTTTIRNDGEGKLYKYHDIGQLEAVENNTDVFIGIRLDHVNSIIKDLEIIGVNQFDLLDDINNN